MCGEKCLMCRYSTMQGGSPPRVRGKGTCLRQGALLPRITPACAGKRFNHLLNSMNVWDHPRVCGEKRLVPTRTISALGSPPRVRGKENVDTYKRRHSRITPACAGKRPPRLPVCPMTLDHPRVCGEKYVRCSCCTKTLGSPPRVRGKEQKGGGSMFVLGITPACAGKSGFEQPPFCKCWDHPRVCGEKTKKSP